MSGTTVNLGNQEVSIYPFQQLSSVFGNETSYGIVTPGVYSSTVTMVDGGANVTFRISAGTTLVFQRSAPNPIDNTIVDTIIGKVVLGTSADFNVPKSSLWTSTYASTVYLIADWTYNITTPTLIYASFSLCTDTNIVATVRNLDGTSSHVLIIAAILNNNYYVTINPAGVPNTSDMSKYHVSYESQPNRDVLKREYIKNNYYRIDFDPNGRGVYVYAGHSMAGDSILFRNPTFNQAYTYTDTTLPFNLAGSGAGIFGEGHFYTDKAIGDVANKILPATGLQYYYSTTSLQSNVPIDIIATATQANYYQIDFLRIKMDEVTHVQSIGWESFLQPVGVLDMVTFLPSYTANTGMTTPNKLAYLAQYTFPFSGDGETLLIAIRPRGAAYGIYTPGVPVADGAGNTLWPESCITTRENAIVQLGSAPRHKRFKLPVWTAADIGAY